MTVIVRRTLACPWALRRLSTEQWMGYSKEENMAARPVHGAFSTLTSVPS